MQRLLTKPGGNAKLAKGNGAVFAPYILHLAPARSAGRDNICPDATRECISLCLNRSGRAEIFPAVLKGRVKKTREFFDNRAEFLRRLEREIFLAIAREGKKGRKAVFRLNGTSDLDFLDIVRKFPTVQFYDYTKNVLRFHNFLLGRLPPNYHLTFSFSGHNESLCRSFLARGGNVAVAFARPLGAPYARPVAWQGFPTIDGDASDLRFRDSPGSVVALRAKGRARKVRNSPFVIGS